MVKAKLFIETATLEKRTILKNCYFTTPFKVMNITENKKAETLDLMLMSSSPGILDGDEYELQIEVGENCSLQLHTQAFQRLFTMKQGAKQSMTVHFHQNSTFMMIPHPAVPHENSSFLAKNQFYLAQHCTLIFGEILTCGRQHEVFKFAKIQNITEIYYDNKLKVKENLLMQPSIFNPSALGQLEGYTHQANFIFLNEKCQTKAVSETCVATLEKIEGIEFGVSTLQVNGLIVRLLGFKAEQLFEILKELQTLALQSL